MCMNLNWFYSPSPYFLFCFNLCLAPGYLILQLLTPWTDHIYTCFCLFVGLHVCTLTCTCTVHTLCTGRSSLIWQTRLYGTVGRQWGGCQQLSQRHRGKGDKQGESMVASYMYLGVSNPGLQMIWSNECDVSCLRGTRCDVVFGPGVKKGPGYCIFQ